MLTRLRKRLLDLIWSHDNILSENEIELIKNKPFLNRIIVNAVIDDMLAQGLIYETSVFQDSTRGTARLFISYSSGFDFSEYYWSLMQNTSAQNLLNLVLKIIDSCKLSQAQLLTIKSHISSRV